MPKIHMKATRARGKSQALDAAPRRAAPTPDTLATIKTLVSLPESDLVWIRAELERHRRATKMRLNQSQLVQVALELLRKRGGLREALKEIS